MKEWICPFQNFAPTAATTSGSNSETP